jgi:glycosyltransferase involved in cell wall biosynthesis
MTEEQQLKPELSIVMPCLNEAETIGDCIAKAKSFINNYQLNAEVVVADNGSTDGSQQIAIESGAWVVHVENKGYGSALIGGIEAARGKYIIMGDSDGSHDLENLQDYIEKLRQGYELVVGNRFKGGIEKNAMSFMHRYIGNPILSGMGRIFFRSKIRDFHCGLRGFTKEAFRKMDLRTSGMEFASEMIVKSTLKDLKITEVATRMLPSGRSREPHLRTFRDGWRHLRFLFLFSPRWLFLYPGFLLIFIGVFINVALLPGSKFNLDIHTMLYGSVLIIVGVQGVSFAILTKVFAVQEQLLPEHRKLNFLLKHATLEKGILIGVLLFLIGFLGVIFSLFLLERGWFKDLSISQTMRVVITSATLIIVSAQVIFSSFFYSILGMKFNRDKK